jgi:lysophospholipase L1-like esterase
MKKIIMLGVALFAVVVIAEPIKIVMIGDSITQGGRNNRKEYTYRWPLFCELVDDGVDFDFIGSRDFGLHKDAKWPEEYKGKKFDLDHEGYYGIKTAAALEKVQVVYTNWVAVPDIALIHLGTNDQGAEDYQKAVKDPLREMIVLLRKQNPNVVIILSHLNFNDSPGAFRIDAFISELRKEMDTENSPVRLVHMFQGWQENPDSPDTDTFDWSHANEQGQKKMADTWYKAMKPYLTDKKSK